MKSLIQSIAIAAALIAPAASFAQTDTTITRAQVRAELIQLESNGYHVGDGDQTRYPAPIQAAESRIAAKNGNTGGYGGTATGALDSGRPTISQSDWNAMYSRS
ncbi:DUF4148 domain-containing protein [Paraburkholderia silviterrae]|uniref:DUF4148 domain-containing protein n=1 Tax=Paraburkholderia silviterrae TaxID=2528715 RepID=A0A4R5M9W8_9BURK|nr:DUF4148 domain-containing protein [Paraburkholderia silviterrae]TDG22787.1 DUF4148 domain-containing protein [Paraburkholderia silviterrae]